MPTSITGPEVEAAFAAARSPGVVPVGVDGTVVEVPTPYPSPPDWRDRAIYFLLVDRFANPLHPPALPYDSPERVFQGGTLAGVRDQLDYLAGLGIGAIWLSPVLKNCQYRPDSYHGYGIQDFLTVDPRFASDPVSAAADPSLAEQELRALVDAAHAHGIHVILDIVLNHTGDVFAYDVDGITQDRADWRDSPYAVQWRDQIGAARPDWPTPAAAPGGPPRDAVVWPVELQRNEVFRRQGAGGEEGGDFESLKELVTAYEEPDAAGAWGYPVRRSLIRAYQYLIARFDVDGFRIDTLKYVEPDFARTFGNAIREYAQSIGKLNFFTFGEVYDGDEKIARFIGRGTSQDGDIVGVDAALDFPLFFVLPGVAKGMRPPTDLAAMYTHRRAVQRDLVSSHGEASRYFVTFLDNHDQTHRFFHADTGDETRYADQLTLALACLYTLPGIPCIYYGTEQGLHGAGNADTAVREALWGRPGGLDRTHPFSASLARLGALRAAEPTLRYGRTYFRPVSGDGVHFGPSGTAPGVLAFSRILNEEELLVVANTSTTSAWSGEVLVDVTLNPPGSSPELRHSNLDGVVGRVPSTGPGPAITKAQGAVAIEELDGRVTAGPARALPLTLQPMEIQVISRSKT